MTAREAAGRRAGDRLERMAAEMADVEDRDRFLELDSGFHVELARASGNALAPLLMEALRETITERMRLAFREVRDWTVTRKRIAAASGAFRSGDARSLGRTA